MKLQLLLCLCLAILTHCHKHTLNCMFDHNNQDLRAASAKQKPDIPIHPSGKYINGRLLTAPSPVRAAMRITLDTTFFAGAIVAGTNGASNTTQTNLNFVLKTMYVAQVFYQSRLQVGQVGTITAPSTCVDFTPSATAQGSGYSNSDLVIFVQYITDGSLGYGATGKSCKLFAGGVSSGSADYTLQEGRPTVGRIIFNTHTFIDQKTITNQVFQSATSTALHETMHILGFDSTLYATYLDPNTGFVYNYDVKTTVSVHANRPATSVITTPYVKAWARAFFGCSSLPGMILQNQDGSGYGGGSHWQRVAMYDELMTGTTLGTKYFSGLTFAMMMDMGWYTVDNSFVETSNYGYQKGCSFLLDACYSSTSFSEFCNTATQPSTNSYCDSNFYGRSLCDSQAGLMADSCGIYAEYASCVDPLATGDTYESYTYQVYSSSSFCLASTLGTVALPSTILSRCYPYSCLTSSIVFTIGPYQITCLSGETGVQKTLSAMSGYLTCPSFTSFCTMSRKTCQNYCNQNGYCMGGVCNCFTGYYGADCSRTSCTSAQYYDPASASCVSTCSSGYYANKFSRSCQPCQSPCGQCLGTPTTCVGCGAVNGVPQYFYNSNCYSTCPTSTYPDASLTCIPCNTTANYCYSCSYSPTNCTSCSPGYYLSQPVSGSCLTSCTGTYSLKDEVNMVCVSACPSNQIAPGNGSCVLCPSGSYYYNAGCNATCTGNYYADQIQRACMTCDTSCQTCDGSYAENCTSCKSSSGNPYLLLKMCWAICPKGFYADPVAGSCTICPTQLYCGACAYNATSTAAYCTTCQYGYFWQSSNNSCDTSCPAGQYGNTWNNSCNPCDPACATCNGPTSYSCMSCLSSYYLLGNSTGGYCLSSCPVLGYIQSGVNCASCDPTCSACNGQSASQCFNCSSGYYLSGGYCRFVCPNATYPNATTGTCQTCDSSCSYCFAGTAGSCTSCATNLYLYNFTCTATCPNGLTPNQWHVCFENNIVTHIAAALLLLVVAVGY